MVFTLFFPKIILSSVALVHAPFWYPVTLLLEFGLILGYNKIFFGNCSWKSLSNLATLITPALFQPPRQIAQDKTKIKLELTNFDRHAHIAFLYFLPIVIYLLVAFPVHMVFYTEVSLLSHSFNGFVRIFAFFLAYVGAFLLYLFLSALYYKVIFFSKIYFQLLGKWFDEFYIFSLVIIGLLTLMSGKKHNLKW